MKHMEIILFLNEQITTIFVQETALIFLEVCYVMKNNTKAAWMKGVYPLGNDLGYNSVHPMKKVREICSGGIEAKVLNSWNHMEILINILKVGC